MDKNRTKCIIRGRPFVLAVKCTPNKSRSSTTTNCVPYTTLAGMVLANHLGNDRSVSKEEKEIVMLIFIFFFSTIFKEGYSATDVWFCDCESASFTVFFPFIREPAAARCCPAPFRIRILCNTVEGHSAEWTVKHCLDCDVAIDLIHLYSI